MIDPVQLSGLYSPVNNDLTKQKVPNYRVWQACVVHVYLIVKNDQIKLRCLFHDCKGIPVRSCWQYVLPGCKKWPEKLHWRCVCYLIVKNGQQDYTDCVHVCVCVCVTWLWRMTGKHMLTVWYLIVNDLQGYTDLCVTWLYRMAGKVRLCWWCVSDASVPKGPPPVQEGCGGH